MSVSATTHKPENQPAQADSRTGNMSANTTITSDIATSNSRERKALRSNGQALQAPLTADEPADGLDIPASLRRVAPAKAAP
jgi:hypothetical protein